MATEASPNLFQQWSVRAQHINIAVGDVDPAPERRPEQQVMHAQHALMSPWMDWMRFRQRNQKYKQGFNQALVIQQHNIKMQRETLRVRILWQSQFKK